MLHIRQIRNSCTKRLTIHYSQLKESLDFILPNPWLIRLRGTVLQNGFFLSAFIISVSFPLLIGSDQFVHTITNNGCKTDFILILHHDLLYTNDNWSKWWWCSEKSSYVNIHNFCSLRTHINNKHGFMNLFLDIFSRNPQELSCAKLLSSLAEQS